MNKYDDIKRFIEKSKTEGLDYKEINEKSMGNGITSSMNKWTLIKQISSGDEPQSSLDNGRTTQPTPQPVTAGEFKSAMPSTHITEVAVPVPAHAEQQKHNMPDIVSPSIVPAAMNILDTLRATLPVFDAAPQFTAQTAAQLLETTSFTESQPAAAIQHQAAGGQFRHMFKQKVPQPAGSFLPGDTPLHPLLEMIASCR